MTRKLLTAGKVGDIAHYVTDGDYCHSDGCLNKLLDEQISYDPAYQGDDRDLRQDREAMWDTLVELGAWTIESNNALKGNAYVVDPTTGEGRYEDEVMPACCVCGLGIVLVTRNQS